MYKRVITAMRQDHYFCKQCSKVLHPKRDINKALGIPEKDHWYKDGLGRVKCSRCNNRVDLL